MLFTRFSKTPVNPTWTMFIHLFRGFCECKTTCEYARLWQMPVSVWNALGWIFSARVTREANHWGETDTVSGWDKVQIFSLSRCKGGKKTHRRENNKYLTEISFFFPSLPCNLDFFTLLFQVVAHRQTSFTLCISTFLSWHKSMEMFHLSKVKKMQPFTVIFSCLCTSQPSK